MALLQSTIIALAGGVLYVIGSAIYNIFFHSLRSFPGPLLWRASVLPSISWLVRGDLPRQVAKLHERYGPVVRIKPHELSFCEADAWEDIYGHLPAGKQGFDKYSGFYRIHYPDRRLDIVGATQADHPVIRKRYAHGFSERSMLAQEDSMRSYVDLLIQRLHETGKDGENACNMREWLNWTTFDIIGDLGLASPFGCLEKSDYHPWISMILDNVKGISFLAAMTELGLKPLARWIMSSGWIEASVKHRAFVVGILRKRMENYPNRRDIIEPLIKMMEKSDEIRQDMDFDFNAVACNADSLLVAGSETTATTLIAATYLLATNPEQQARLAHEVRSTFKTEDEITLTGVNGLPYMLACLQEAMRCYPPPIMGMPRQVGRGGGIIAGTHVPEDTVVAVWQWAINNSPRIWVEPDTFQPERFLGADKPAKFKADRTNALRPFGSGPRDCIGKTLAYAEMRLILARLIWNFDFKIHEDSKGFIERSKGYILWEKPALNVYLKPVQAGDR